MSQEAEINESTVVKVKIGTLWIIVSGIVLIVVTGINIYWGIKTDVLKLQIELAAVKQKLEEIQKGK